MSRLCAVVLFFGVSHPRSVSSPSLPPALLLRLAPSYPPLKVTFSDASLSVSKSCDSFLSVTVVDPPNPSILEIASSLASLSGGFVEVSLPARASFPFTSLSKPLSPVEEVISLRSAGVFSPSASVRCLTAVCSPWSLVCFQICSILCDSGGSSLRVVTIGVHAYSFGCVASPATAALSLDHFRIGYLTSIESKSSDKFSPVNLGLLGICCPFISFLEQRRFPKLPLLSGLDVQASPVLQGSSSWLMLFSALVAFFVTPRAVDAVIQEAYDIVIFRFLMVSFFDLYRQFISKFNHCLVFFMAFVALLWCIFLLLAVIPPTCRV